MDKELELEILWNNNQVSKLVGYIVKNLPWIDDFYKQHSVFKKVYWHRLFTILLIYKRLEITALLGIFRKLDSDINNLLLFFLYAENQGVIIWDDLRNQYFLNNLDLSDEIQERINLLQYPMPLIIKPEKLTTNFSSPYKIVNRDNVVLSGSEGSEDINLDHINRLNSIQYEVNTDVAISCNNVWEAKKGNVTAVKQNLKRYMYYCYKAMELIFNYGNKFYFSWKYDKRGRSYPQGYYLNPQGTDYNKYCLEFANKEKVL